MPEPTSTTAAAAVLHTVGTPAIAVPLITVMGVSLGLRADVLLAGFAGSVAAMSLLNTVPSTGDTWRELVATSLRRLMVAVASSGFAGYAAPLLALVNGVPEQLLLSVAFIAGAGAQSILQRIVMNVRTTSKGEAPSQ